MLHNHRLIRNKGILIRLITNYVLYYTFFCVWVGYHLIYFYVSELLYLLHASKIISNLFLNQFPMLPKLKTIIGYDLFLKTNTQKSLEYVSAVQIWPEFLRIKIEFMKKNHSG